ncbi:MAG: DUF885 domain-containing protein, partial [Candidatus Limnocylindria bacterium]
MTTTTPLDQLAADYWDAWLERHPASATALGDHRFNDRLADESPAAHDAWRAALDGLEQRLPATEPTDPTTHAALAEALNTDRAFLEADLRAFTVDPMDGPQVELLNIPSYQPTRTDDDAQTLLARWEAMPAYLDQAGRNLQRGAADGRIGVATLCAKVVDQIDAVLERRDEEWSLAQPGEKLPAICDELIRLIGQRIRPAYERYRSTIADEIAPRARSDDEPGLVHMPGGADTYAALARAHTSVDVAPEEVHAIGLAEIERIDGEFTELGAHLLDTHGLAATLRTLRGDPDLHFQTRDEVFEVAKRSLDQANAAIGQWFGRLPQAPCEVVRMAAHEEEHSTIAYYLMPAADGSRPGQHHINTYAPETRPRYEAETLAFHESVPGHHLQIAIAQELGEVPAFRRFNGSTAYVEGWGLYTERLSEEMGLLTGPMDRFGVLSFDAWRASRLVVDTGIHAMGWTRQEAITFMTEHTALGENNIANEVDRYIAYPGQALAYKLGQLELLRLRAEARARQ